MTLTGFVAGWFSGSSGGAVGMTCASTGLAFFAFAASFWRSAGAVLSGAGSLSCFCFAAGLNGGSSWSFSNSRSRCGSSLSRRLSQRGLAAALCRLDFISCGIYVLCMSGGNCTEDHGYEKQFLHGSLLIDILQS
jgi:hypothetical protein